MILYRCTHGHADLRGIRAGAVYEKVCVGLRITTEQRLVTYRGVGGKDDGAYFHTTLSHWEQAFKVVEVQAAASGDSLS